jgi:hypothetical protein
MEWLAFSSSLKFLFFYRAEMNKLFTSLSIFLISALLISCGGGGSSSSNTSSEPSQNNSLALTRVMSYQNEHGVSQVFNTHVADLNGDGLEDVIVAGWAVEPDGYTGSVNSKIPVRILIQQFDGSLLDKTVQLLGATNSMIFGAQRIIVEDFDADGRPDIFFSGFQDVPSQTATSVIFWNEGSSFTRADFPELVWAHATCSGDLRGNGRKDLVMGAEGGRPNSIYLNNGNRTFTLNSSLISAHVSAAGACSVIKDPITGNVGIVTTNYVGFNSFSAILHVFDNQLNLLSSVGLPGSEEVGVAYNLVHDLVNIMQIDLNNDGRLDLVITDNGDFRLSRPVGSFLALINEGNLTFSNQTSTYFPTQTNDYIFGYFSNSFELNGYKTFFVNNANPSFAASTFWQLSSGKFQKYLSSDFNAAIGRYTYPTVYRTRENRFNLLLIDGSTYPSFTFYAKSLN